MGNNIIYCHYCQQFHKEGYIHTCSGIVDYGYSTSFDTPTKYYKCPQCKGEFSEPFKRFTGKYKNADIKEFGSEVIVGNTKVPIEKYVCPFCGKIMKGLN